MCDKLDSIQHAFLQCQPFVNFCEKSIHWLNDLHKTTVNLTPLQIFFNFSTPASNLSNNHIKVLSIPLLYSKQYYYACKTMQKKVDVSEFICNLILQLKIDKSAWCIYVTLPPFFS